MKKLQTTAIVAALLCGTSFAAQARSTAEQVRDVPSFKEVSLHGSMDVEIAVGSSQSVKVIADDDIIDNIETEVRGDELRIGLERGHYSNIKVMRVVITMPEMTGANIHGSGDMIVKDVKADRFDLELQGSGDATFSDATFGDIEIELHGSGDIELDGTCTSIDIELQGSGDVDAGKLKCTGAKVSLRGSGDVEVYANESADVGVHGSGDIVVRGEPDKLNSRVRGSGDIIIR
ncbi:head GIN domain-containing protein [Kordiimonas sp.]|uniref:head GIN domain-containing protein n=1 Tax=Kordiimonas sp. TaxID=1970157 RepID=UPI003A94F9C8